MRLFYRLLSSVCVVGVTAFGLWLVPSQADACGGCFAPSEQVTVVTGHRMAVAMSATETTLWDQIEYAGDPDDFVWVLPIAGETLVELADNAFFEALDQSTRITLQGTFPPLNTFCPDPCAGSGGAFASGARDSDGEAPAPEDPVMVFGEAVVGPYETATIGSEDPMALVNWLQDNGYGVTDAILPIITHYVEQGLNFSVLRLNPNAGVNQMQPVRVTTPGMMPVFPLRMVAAGVEGNVGLELYVFSEGRSGSQNFDIAEVDSSDLFYDWETSAFNYNDAFDQTIEEAGGRVWIAEYAQPADRYRYQIENYVRYDPDTGESTPDAAAEDWAVVTRAISNPYLTKLRTDLDADFLDEDIVLEAAFGDDIENFISVDREVNRPPEPSCPTTCTDPTRPGGMVVGSPGELGFGGTGRGDGLCSASFGSGTPWTALGLLGLVLSGFIWRRRRR